ncbi:S53 family peptidase [Solihabitans fulvus]|nr:S53 family peptidase [Solihabitans fulvus]
MAGALPSSAAASDRASIPDSKPSWATPQAKVADAAPASKLTFRVYLKLRDQAGAEAAARAVSDPSSSAFRHYLTTDQVRAAYAPERRTVDAVRGWLGSAGITVGSVPANNQYVEATGTVDQVQHVFGVNLAKYDVKGAKLRAADRNLSVPATLAPQVLGVVGVDQALNLLKPSHVTSNDTTTKANEGKATTKPTIAPPPDGLRNSTQCSSYWGEKVDTTDPTYGGGFPSPLNYSPCGYQPAQIRSVYGLDQAVNWGFDGRGTTVAIIDAFASPTIYEDASQYAARHDAAHPLRKEQFNQLVFPETDPTQEDACGASGWYGEETLDVEAVHATAPGANILYVGGSDCQDLSLDKALNEVVSKNLAQIVSNSYGNQGEDVPADEVNAFSSIAQQAALEGIGVYFSSGDNGDEVSTIGTASPDFSASSPWVTAVGGTSLGIGKDGKRVFETGWETGRSVLSGGVYTPSAPGAYQYGSGGGTSRLFPEPFYQKGVVPDALAAKNQTGTNRGRVVPDISMLGDPNTGFLVGETQTFPAPEGVHYDEYRIGGTSLSSPLFAGMMAVSDQFTHFRHGFINPWLYKVTSHTPAITDVQHVSQADVRVDFVNGLDATGGLRTTVRSFDYPGLAISTARGYDDVTGLGTPNGFWFLALS